MLEKTTPEKVGISSKNIKKFISVLEKNHLSTHAVLMMRHGKVFYENYRYPFNADYLHRVYSVSKSFVSLAIGFLADDGIIDIDAPMVNYLPPYAAETDNENIKKQTIRDMLMMSTGAPQENSYWFSYKPQDRLKEYFNASRKERGGTSKLPGTLFDYDSPGSFVLCCIAEILSGKNIIDYLREKFLDAIGFSKEAYCLSCPGGHSWGDSGILCKASDLALVVQFLLREGKWNGKQFLSKKYVKEATSNLINSNETGFLTPCDYGYGFQIWKTERNGFYFNGMGSQFAVGVPDKDMVFVIFSDNQGHPAPSTVILNRFFEEIVEKADDFPIADNDGSFSELKKYSETLELFSLKNDILQNIYEKEYIMDPNPMGITRLKITVSESEGILNYTNAQGEKSLKFGINKNIFGIFPEEGYSDLIGNRFAPGNYYKCASSACWTHKNCLSILVQIIDKYFGRLYMRISFTKENKISLIMKKNAEDFLQTYNGYAEGSLK